MGIENFAVPGVIGIIILAALIKKVPVFDVFLEGAKDGLDTAISILPALVALIVSVGIFKASGALDMLCFALTPIANLIMVPAEVIPLTLLRPISGSGALVVFTDIIETFGPDSYIGKVASVIQGSTETTVYTIAVYYGATKVRDSRYNLPASLTADIVGFIMSGVAVRLMIGD